MAFLNLILLISLVLGASTLKLPKYIHRCSRSDPNLNECVLSSARAALPTLINGDRKLGWPSFNPFAIPHVDLYSDQGLKLALNNLTVSGLADVQLLNMTIDVVNRKAKMRSYIGQLNVVADYLIAGRILFIPLTGSGPCKLSLINGTYEYDFGYDLEKRSDGKEYAKINDSLSSYKYDIEKEIFHFENLFNGDKRLGDETNRLLNEGWKEINEDLRPSVLQALISIHGIVGNIIARHIPFDEIVLP